MVTEAGSILLTNRFFSVATEKYLHLPCRPQERMTFIEAQLVEGSLQYVSNVLQWCVVAILNSPCRAKSLWMKADVSGCTLSNRRENDSESF